MLEQRYVLAEIVVFPVRHRSAQFLCHPLSPSQTPLLQLIVIDKDVVIDICIPWISIASPTFLKCCRDSEV